MSEWKTDGRGHWSCQIDAQVEALVSLEWDGSCWHATAEATPPGAPDYHAISPTHSCRTLDEARGVAGLLGERLARWLSGGHPDASVVRSAWAEAEEPACG